MPGDRRSHWLASGRGAEGQTAARIVDDGVVEAGRGEIHTTS